MKTILLAHMLKISKKLHNLVLDPVNWKQLLQNAMNIAGRAVKDQSLAAEAPIVAYMSKLIEFLHGSRKYLTSSTEECDILIAESMEKLKDLRQVYCIEGLLMMVNCLPANYSGYENILPKWISVWCSVSQNAKWDMCWLTLLTRARKYTTNYDWKALMPLFALKTRELLGLPGIGGNSENKAQAFFPPFFDKLQSKQFDPKLIALKKLAKLIYFTTICDEINSSTVLVKTDPLTITPPKPSGINANDNKDIPGYNCSVDVLPIVTDIVVLFQSLRPFFYASNSGSWTKPLAFFTNSFVGKIIFCIFLLFPFTTFFLWTCYRLPIHISMYLDILHLSHSSVPKHISFVL